MGSGEPPTGNPPEEPGARAGSGVAMISIRYVLPLLVTLAGLVVMALGGENNLEGGAGIVSAGAAIYMVNWLFRAGATGDLEREREAAARDYFSEHGRWPD